MIRKITTALTLLCLSLGLAPLAAQETRGIGDDRSWLYLGANYGWYKAKGGDFDDDTDLVEGQIGYHFTPAFALEAGYIDFGDFGDRNVEADADGWTAAAVLRFALTDTTALYGKVGMLFWDADVRSADEVSEAVDDSDLFYGAGVDFRFSPLLSLLVEYVRYEIDIDGSDLTPPIRGGPDIDALKAGLRLNF